MSDNERWGPGTALVVLIGASFTAWGLVVAFLAGLRTIAGWFR